VASASRAGRPRHGVGSDRGGHADDRDGANGDKIQRYAVESGMITRRQSGFRQAARGLTTLEAVLTVAMDAE